MKQNIFIHKLLNLTVEIRLSLVVATFNVMGAKVMTDFYEQLSGQEQCKIHRRKENVHVTI